MRIRNPFAQAVFLIVLAFVIAVVTNAFAGRTRRLVPVAYYPNALRVPPKEPVRVPPPPRLEPVVAVPPTATATVPTATIEPAITTTAPATTTAPVTTTAPIPATATAPPERRAEARPTLDLSKFQPHPDRAYVEISGDDAAALHAAGTLFLDARRTSVYEDGHIAGARSFSVWEADVDDKVNALFEERSDPTEQNKPIVIYCSGGACEDSHMLAQKLWGIQFNNVYVYKDGFPDWQKRSLPQKTGGQP